MTNSLMKKLLPILITLLKLPLWLLLTGFIAHGIATLETEQYQRGDVINDGFRVAVVDGYARSLSELKSGEFQLQTTPDADYMEDRLYVNDDGTLTYHNEGAMWHSRSTYRIEHGEVVPVSFYFLSLGYIFYGMIGATVVMLFGNYAVRRFLYRHDKNKLTHYHKAIIMSIKKTVLFTILFVAIYMVMAWLR